MNANKASLRNQDSKDAAAGADAPVEVPKDTTATRAIAAEITARGAKLFDLLKEEQQLRDARQKVCACVRTGGGRWGSLHLFIFAGVAIPGCYRWQFGQQS